MPYAREDRFAPSQNPYAIHPVTWDRSTRRVEAIWAGRKNGVTTITTGTIHLWNPREKPGRLEAALAIADTRYGGEWLAKFDGSRLLINPGLDLAPDQYAPLAATLGAFLDGLPSVPRGYEGWYYR